MVGDSGGRSAVEIVEGGQLGGLDRDLPEVGADVLWQAGDGGVHPARKLGARDLGRRGEGLRIPVRGLLEEAFGIDVPALRSLISATWYRAWAWAGSRVSTSWNDARACSKRQSSKSATPCS